MEERVVPELGAGAPEGTRASAERLGRSWRRKRDGEMEGTPPDKKRGAPFVPPSGSNRHLPLADPGWKPADWTAPQIRVMDRGAQDQAPGREPLRNVVLPVGCSAAYLMGDLRDF